ncbi:unnamed protein product [Urochloa humidicola]
MEAEEARLRFAILAQVGNASRGFTTADVSLAVAEATGLAVACYPTFPTYPENFLVICTNQEARDRALAASPAPMATTFLSLRPWTRLVRADSTVLYQRVHMELDGIPEHAWDLDTASKLLARHAWVERLDPATASKTDMSTFKLTAWTEDPYAIPGSMSLCIAEPELHISYSDEDMQRIFGNLDPYLRQKRILTYPVHIHLRSIADFRSRTPSSSDSSPSDDGDSGPNGNPDRSYGFRRGSGPRLTGFPRRRIGGGGAGSGAGDKAGGATGGHVMQGRTRWRPINDQSKSKATSPSTQKQQKPSNADSSTHGATKGADIDITTVAPVAGPDAGEAIEASQAEPPTAVTQDWATVCATQYRVVPPLRALDPMLTEATKAKVPLGSAPRQGSAGIRTHALPQASPADLSRTDFVCSPVGEDLTLAFEVATTGAHGEDGTRHSDSAPEACPAGLPATVAAQEMGRENVHGPPDDLGPDSPPGFSRSGRRAEAMIHTFTSQVQAKIRSPLAVKPVKTKRTTNATPGGPVGLPKRSSRLANHPLAGVASSKRAEVILMRRFQMIPEATTPTSEGKRAYEQLYKEGVQNEHFEAMSDLLPALRNLSPILGMQA